MKKVLNILTPENVYVEYELAGIGSRFAAFIIDLLIQLATIALIIVAMIILEFDFLALFIELQFQVVTFAVTLIILFHLLYFSFFEPIMGGQTPGKKALGIRVISQRGEPVSVFESILRNFLRIVYVFPFLYLMDALFVILTKNYKRVGDFAANTVVVKVRRGEKLLTLDDIIENNAAYVEYSENANIYPVTHFEYEVLKEFLARKDSVGKKRYIFAYNFNRYFSRKFNLQEPYSNPYDFFEDIIRMNSGMK